MRRTAWAGEAQIRRRRSLLGQCLRPLRCDKRGLRNTRVFSVDFRGCDRSECGWYTGIVHPLNRKTRPWLDWPRRILIATLPLVFSAVCLADVQTIERERLYANYRAQLEQLAKSCDERSLTRQAEFARKW